MPKSLAVARRLEKLKVDRVHAHFATHTTTLAAIAGIVSAIPYSFTAHAYDIYCKALKSRNDTLDFKLRHAVQVFAVSDYAKNLLRERLPADRRDRVQTAYVGIPLDLFREEKPLPRVGKLKLLCIARFEEKKGLDTLIDACAMLRDQRFPFHLAMYGEGPSKEALGRQIRRHRLEEQITLSGPIPQEEVARHMKNSHIFVIPCRQDKTGNMDGIPTVFMETMAIGRPVISCPISGIPDLVRHLQTGLLVPSNDPQSLLSAMLRLGTDDELRLRLGRQGRALVELQHDQVLNTRRLLNLMIDGDRAACRAQKGKNHALDRDSLDAQV